MNHFQSKALITIRIGKPFKKKLLTDNKVCGTGFMPKVWHLYMLILTSARSTSAHWSRGEHGRRLGERGQSESPSCELVLRQ